MQLVRDSASLPAWQAVLLTVGGASAGAVAALALAPAWLPGVAASLVGPKPTAAWYLVRGSGVVAYLLLWLAVILGLLLTNRLARVWPGGPTATDLHQFTSLLAVGVSAFHGAILLADRYLALPAAEIIVPFAVSDYRPFWTGLGQVGFYLTLIIAGSVYVRRRIGYRAWRMLHYASYAAFVLVTLHGLGAGTDATSPFMLGLYAATALSTLFLTIVRILGAARQPRVVQP